MNDLEPERIFTRLFHRHKPVVIRKERHPEIRGLFFEYRKCKTCGQPLKMKVRAE